MPALSFPGSMPIESRIFSVGFHLRGESLLPVGETEKCGLSVEAAVSLSMEELGDFPQEKARPSTEDGCWWWFVAGTSPFDGWVGEPLLTFGTILLLPLMMGFGGGIGL